MPVADKWLRVAAGCLALMLACFIWVAAGGVAAGTYHQRAHTLYEGWARVGTIDTRETWQFGHELAQRGLAIEPENPKLLALSARIKEAYAYSPVPDWTAYVTLLAEAETQLAQALAQRPLWAYDWAHLAMLHARRLQFADPFDHAVKQALSHGPREDLVLQQVVRAGFLGWGRLETGTQSTLVDAFERGVYLSGGQTGSLFGIAEQFGYGVLMCDTLAARGVKEDYIGRHCSHAIDF